MKLLLENWQRYLNEDSSYFGKTFQNFKKRVEKGEHPIKVAEETMKMVGQGSMRKVFELPDNKNYLLKIINVEIVGDEEYYAPDWKHPRTRVTRYHKIQANEWETSIELQQKYPGIFPRSYEAAADFSWVLVERLEPVTWPIFQKMLNLDGVVGIEDIPDLIAEAVDFMKSTYVGQGDEWERTHKSLQEAPALSTMMSYLNPEEESDDTPVRPQAPSKKRPPALEIPGREDNLFALKSILSVPHNRRLFLAAAEMDIPHREIAPRNLGLSTIGESRLVLLDSSIIFIDTSKKRGKF